MKKKSLSMIVVAILLFAGCLDEQEDPAPVEDAESDPDPGREDEIQEEVQEEIRPLSVVLSANITNGTVPLDVSFLIDANKTEDSNATWELDIESVDRINGTDFPSVVNVTFEKTGDFMVKMNVTSGNETKQGNVTVSVLPRAFTGAVFVVIEGSAAVGHPGEEAVCVRNEVDGDIHEIAPAGPGWSYRITPVETFTVYWWSEPNPVFAMGGFVASGDDSGTIPDGATHVEVCLQTGNTMEEYMLTLWNSEVVDIG